MTSFWDGRTDGRTDGRSGCTPRPAFALSDAGTKKINNFGKLIFRIQGTVLLYMKSNRACNDKTYYEHRNIEM